jgi:hypothetical protein
MKREFKTVTAEEFEQFLRNYPRILDVDVCQICEPPFKSFNDFNIGNWPDSIVAKITLNEAWGQPNEYQVLVEIPKLSA